MISFLCNIIFNEWYLIEIFMSPCISPLFGMMVHKCSDEYHLVDKDIKLIDKYAAAKASMLFYWRLLPLNISPFDVGDLQELSKSAFDAVSAMVATIVMPIIAIEMNMILFDDEYHNKY